MIDKKLKKLAETKVTIGMMCLLQLDLIGAERFFKEALDFDPTNETIEEQLIEVRKQLERKGPAV